MSISARDLFFILRARDEATAVFDRVGRDLVRMGAAAEAASARSNAAALRQQAQNLRTTGGTKEQIAALEQDAAAWENHARKIEADRLAQERLARTLTSMGAALTIVGLALAGAGLAVTAALFTTVKAASDYGKQVALTHTQVDGFTASLDTLGNMGKDIANRIAVPFKEIQPALYNIFSSTNANLAQSKILLEAFAKTAVAGAVSIGDASKGTMTILNGFHLPFEKVNDVLDIQFQLVRKGVGTYAEFNSVLGRIIPSANRAGQNFQTVAAMLAFMTRNGQSAAMASTAGARALDAFSNPKTIEHLKSVGIAATDVKGNFLPLVDVLKLMYDKMLPMSQLKRSEFLQQMFLGSGGTIQARRFIDQVLQPGQFQAFVGFLGDMQHATGQFTAAYNTMADQTASKTQIMKNNWETLKVTVGQILTPIFTVLVGILGKMLLAFNNLSPGMQSMIVKGTLLGAVISIIGGLALIVLGGIAALAGALAGIGLSLGAIVGGGAATILAITAIGVFFYDAWKKSVPFRDLMKDIGSSFSYVWGVLKQGASEIKDKFDKDLIPALKRLETLIDLEVIPRAKDMYDALWTKHKKDWIDMKNAVVDAADKGFKVIGDTITNVLIPALKYLIDQYDKHKTGINQVISDLASFAKWTQTLSGKGFIIALTSSIASLIGFFAVLAVMVAMAIGTLSMLANWINFVIQWIKRIIEWLGHWTDMGRQVLGSMQNLMSSVTGLFTGLPGRIANAVGDLSNVLVNAGRQIISGLMHGISSSLGALGNLLSSVGSFIASHKGPPEKDAVMLRPAGQLVMRGFILGIDDMVPVLGKKLSSITASISPTVNAQINGNGAINGNGSKTNNITINVYTQEISPQYNAAQLGNYLAARV